MLMEKLTLLFTIVNANSHIRHLEVAVSGSHTGAFSPSSFSFPSCFPNKSLIHLLMWWIHSCLSFAVPAKTANDLPLERIIQPFIWLVPSWSGSNSIWTSSKGIICCLLYLSQWAQSYYYILRGKVEPCARWGSQQLLEREALASLVRGNHVFLNKVNIYPFSIKRIKPIQYRVQYFTFLT